MSRTETIKILSVLRAAYPQFYKDMTKNELEGIVSLWQEMFARDEYMMVSAAVKSVIDGDPSSFPPAIGKIKEKLRTISSYGQKELTEQDAWNLVAKAVKNGLYGAREEFDRLPVQVQKIVGSPNMLKEWAMMDTDSLHSVVASNFQRSFRARAAASKEYASLPEDVKQMVGLLGNSNTKMLGEW